MGKKNKAKRQAQMLAQAANEAQNPVTEPTTAVEAPTAVEKAGATTYAELKDAIKQSVKDADSTDIHLVTIDKVLKAAAAEIIHSLYLGKSVRIPDIGTFSVVDRAERNGVNPRTGEKIVIPARRAVHFSPSKVLKDTING